MLGGGGGGWVVVMTVVGVGTVVTGFGAGGRVVTTRGGCVVTITGGGGVGVGVAAAEEEVPHWEPARRWASVGTSEVGARDWESAS